MLTAALFNFMALLVATGQRRIAAGAMVLLGAVAYQSYLVVHGNPLEASVFLAEGVIASLVLFFCGRKDRNPALFYVLGLLPTLALIAAVLWVDVLRDAFHKDLAASWQAQEALLRQWTKGQSADLPRIGRWVGLLFPAYWALSGLFRIWVVRYAALVFAGRRQTGLPWLRFVDLRLTDMFAWVLAAGLLFEAVSFERVNIVGHNVLVFAGALYLLQGIAVIQSFFIAYKVSVFLIMLFYGIMLMTQVPLAFVAVIGFSDTWLEFRNRLRPPSAKNE